MDGGFVQVLEHASGIVKSKWLFIFFSDNYFCFIPSVLYQPVLNITLPSPIRRQSVSSQSREKSPNIWQLLYMLHPITATRIRRRIKFGAGFITFNHI